MCYITTGGCVPEGADAVVMVEETQRLSDSRVSILKGASPRQNIREVSSDMSVGDKVLSAGDLVGPAEIGLLATVGAVQPLVRPQVCVGAEAGRGREARPSAWQHARINQDGANGKRAFADRARSRLRQIVVTQSLRTSNSLYPSFPASILPSTHPSTTIATTLASSHPPSHPPSFP